MLAMEIVPVNPDRPPLPNWEQTRSGTRSIVPADRVLSVLGRFSGSFSSAAMIALRRAAALGTGVEVILTGSKGSPAPAGPVQVVVQGHRFTVSGPARGALLALVDLSGNSVSQAETVSPSSLPSMAEAIAATDVATAARAMIVERQVAGLRALLQQSGNVTAGDAAIGNAVIEIAPIGIAPIGVAPTAAPPLAANVELPQPLTLTTSSGALPVLTLARNLAQAVENSGLFLESHLAAWVQGRRSVDQLQAEFAALRASATLALPWDTQIWSGQRAASQFVAQQNQAFALTGQVWPGQEFHLKIEQERPNRSGTNDAAQAGATTVATLAINLPNLGEIRTTIRVAALAVGVQMQASDAAALRHALPSLASALAARNLSVVQLMVQNENAAPEKATSGVLPRYQSETAGSI